jgi:hypothetical protein
MPLSNASTTAVHTPYSRQLPFYEENAAEVRSPTMGGIIAAGRSGA